MVYDIMSDAQRKEFEKIWKRTFPSKSPVSHGFV